MPLLTRAHAREAEAVLRGGADVAFGPALDGGYWMVGPVAAVAGPVRPRRRLGRARRCWSARSSVREAAGLRTELLGMERDLDDPADARALAGHPRLPPAVAEVLG